LERIYGHVDEDVVGGGDACDDSDGGESDYEYGDASVVVTTAWTRAMTLT
jgi:hypothetical protein